MKADFSFVPPLTGPDRVVAGFVQVASFCRNLG